MRTKEAKIESVRGWCWADRAGRLYPVTFYDVPGEQGKTGCCAAALNSLDWIDRTGGRPVPVELRPLQTER